MSASSAAGVLRHRHRLRPHGHRPVGPDARQPDGRGLGRAAGVRARCRRIPQQLRPRPCMGRPRLRHPRGDSSRARGGWCSPWRPAGPERRMASRSTRCSRPRDRRAQSTSLDLLSLLSPARATTCVPPLVGERRPASESRRGTAAAGLPGVCRCPRPDPEGPRAHVGDRSSGRPEVLGQRHTFGADIDGARVIEVAGVDLLLWLPDSEAVVAEIEDFLTGERRPAPVHRQLLTVMFTDVVGSTTSAATAR